MLRPYIPKALTIAGSDPSGGAGLQADLKTFHQHGVYGMAAVSLITVQNTRSVARVDVLSAALVKEQIEAVLSDITPQAVKTGALGNAEVIGAVAAISFPCPLVVDPVMVSKHGHVLLAADALDALIALLLPVTTLLTPNTQEAALLWGKPVDTLAQAEDAARAISRLGPQSVLVKGGHLQGDEAIDVLWHQGTVTHCSSARFQTPHTHGTGCTYSAAITANLAQGMDVVSAIRVAKAWLTRALKCPPDVGQGIGPVNHGTNI
jgi:hydroxymethylpyrimidine/phosphomethylpyrimidine kinase